MVGCNLLMCSECLCSGSLGLWVSGSPGLRVSGYPGLQGLTERPRDSETQIINCTRPYHPFRYALKKKKNDIIWEFFPTWGGVFPNPKTFVNLKNSAFLGQKQVFLGKKCTITWYIFHISYFILHISYFFG